MKADIAKPFSHTTLARLVQASFPFGLVTMSAVSAVGCESPEAKQCDRMVKVSLASLSAMNPSDSASVEETRAGLEEALTACEKAKRKNEVKDINDALGNVGTHLKRLKEAKARAANPSLRSAEEWAKIEKEGDPACPLGQAYRRPDKKEPMILCSGPTLLERGWKLAGEHFAAHGFQIMAKGSELRATKGPQEFVFSFEKPDSEKAAACIKAKVVAGQEWKHVVAALTNVKLSKLEKDKPVEAEGRKVPLKVVEGDVSWVLLGECPIPDAPEAGPGEKAPSTAAVKAPAADVAAKKE